MKALESRLETARIQQGELPGLDRERRRQASLEEVRLQQELEPATNRLMQAQGARKALVKAEDIPFVWDIAFVEVFEGEKAGFDIVKLWTQSSISPSPWSGCWLGHPIRLGLCLLSNVV